MTGGGVSGWTNHADYMYCPTENSSDLDYS